MIIYETNQHFWSDITHLSRSWTMRKIIRGSLGVGACTAVFCFLFIEIWPKEFTIPSTIFSLLGIVLSVLMVFRTNSAYDRWYEGRRLWGTLVNNCRNLAIMIQTTFPKEDTTSRTELALLISNFCIALKEHLRKGVIWNELIRVTPEQIVVYKTKKHLPNYLTLLIHQKVQAVYRSGAIGEADMINFKPHLQAFLDVAGACERIKKTPIPFSYSVYIKLLILGYSVMLPFGLIQDFGYFTIPLVTFIFFTFIGIEMLASEIEDPFGLDCNDLPTGNIAKTIATNVFEILSSEEEKPASESIENELYTKVF